MIFFTVIEKDAPESDCSGSIKAKQVYFPARLLNGAAEVTYMEDKEDVKSIFFMYYM